MTTSSGEDETGLDPLAVDPRRIGEEKACSVMFYRFLVQIIDSSKLGPVKDLASYLQEIVAKDPNVARFINEEDLIDVDVDEATADPYENNVGPGGFTFRNDAASVDEFGHVIWEAFFDCIQRRRKMNNSKHQFPKHDAGNSEL